MIVIIRLKLELLFYDIYDNLHKDFGFIQQHYDILEKKGELTLNV